MNPKYPSFDIYEFQVKDEAYQKEIQKNLYNLLQITKSPHIFPGAQPVSFQKEHLRLLEESEYYVCEKSDGTRYLLYYAQPPTGPNAFLIDRAYRIYELPGVSLPDRKNSDRFITDTCLDGELVTDKNGELTFYIFDCLLFDGTPMCHHKLPLRLRAVQNEVIQVFKGLESEETPYPFRLALKEMHKPYGISDVLKNISNLQHANDGLIFTPVNEPYVSGTMQSMLKWKPSHKNSIDFMLGKTKDKTWDILIGDSGNISSHYGTLKFKSDDDEKAYSDPTIFSFLAMSPEPGQIVECSPIIDSQHQITGWAWDRFRADKLAANHKSVVDSIIKSILNSVTEKDLVSREGAIRQKWKAREATLKHTSLKHASLKHASELPAPKRPRKLE